MAVLLEMRHRAFGRVDRDMGEVRTAQSLDLRVEIGEITPLKQRVVREVDAWRHILGAEGDLLGLGEEIIDDPVEHQPPDDADGHQFLRDQLGRVEDVEVEAVGKRIVEQLHAQLPLREVAAVDRIPKVAAMEIRVRAIDLDRLVPHHRLQTLLGLPVELDEGGLAVGIHQPERMDAKAFHRAERARDRAVGHLPHDHMHAYRRQANEVPEIIVRRLCLRKLPVGRGLHRMDQVGKLDRILNEENRDIVADQIPIALLRIELDGETADVTGKIGRAL